MEEGWEGSDVEVCKCVMGLAGLSTKNQDTEEKYTTNCRGSH